MANQFVGGGRYAGHVPAGGYLRAAGQIATGVDLIPSVDESTGQGDQKFQLITLPFPGYEITAPDGTVINPLNVPQNVTGIVKQWMDPDLAAACFAQARTFADTMVASANGPAGPQDAVGANALRQAVWWIMMGYNAINIPWYMDPGARALYRQFLAGPPQQYGGITATAEYGPLLSYNTQWFVPGHIDPGLSQSVISQKMQALIKSVPELNDPSTQQVPTIWPITAVPQTLGGPVLPVKNAWNVNVTLGGGSGAVNPSDPTYAPYIENFFVWKGFQDEQDFSLVQPPIDCGASNGPSAGGSTSGCQTRDWQHPSGPNIDNTHPLNGVTNGSWRTFGWQNNPFNPKLISTPIIFYVPWVDAWASYVTSKSPADLVLASRLYTIYVNASKATQSGGATTFANQVLALPQALQQQSTTGSEQTDLQIAAAAAGTIGAALSVVTYGISALIGGAVALGLTVAGASVKNSPQIARDDLGRFKPIIDRGWLAGDPSTPGDLGKPPISITAPKGWIRPAPATLVTAMNPHWLPMINTSQSNAVAPSIPSGYMLDANGNIVPIPQANDYSWLWWTLGTVVVIGAGYVGYRVVSAPPPTPPTPKTNPRKRRR